MANTRQARARIIQVGLGGWGRNWHRTVLAPRGDVEVVAIVDPSREALGLAAAQLGIDGSRCFTALAKAMAAFESDAVLITASLPGHVPNALAALRAGKHVLLEKPFAPSVKAAAGVVQAAREAGRVLMISQNYRFFPAPIGAAKLVAGGSLGKLGAIHIDFRRDSIAYSKDRERHYRLPHPLLADMAIHHFDLMRMVAGRDAKRIRCHAYNPPWSHYKDPPASEVVVEMASGLPITYRGSWVSPGAITPWAGEWRMEFEKGEVRWRSRGDETGELDSLVIRKLGGAEREVRLPRMREVDRGGAVTEFLRCIATGDEPATSGRANIGSIALTYGAIRAASTGGWVTLAK